MTRTPTTASKGTRFLFSLATIVSVTCALTGCGISPGSFLESGSQGGSQPPASVSAVPPGSSFVLPPANACQSNYDQFYESEPGVYAYWALCEAGNPAQIYDYVGSWDLTKGSGAFGSGQVTGGAPGPVQDGETASFVSSATQDIASQNIPLNMHQGTIAAWVSGDAKAYPLPAVSFRAVGGKSGVAIRLQTGDHLCFSGTFTDTKGSGTTVQHCGYSPNSWHRVVLSWADGAIVLSIDGAPVANGSYTGILDNNVFYYQLFPGCCALNLKMTLAKVSIANRTWDARQVAADTAHQLAPVPTGGVYVSSERLGTIHRAVLGYADYNQNMSSSARRDALRTGLAAGGFTALRYAGSSGGIGADLVDWQTGVSCSPEKGEKVDAANQATKDNMDTYLPVLAKPLQLDVVYTVNYGTNAPYCDAGGDPIRNGADLVQYANIDHGYGIKYWEIGNELYSATTETDFHPQPNTGASYGTYEPAFYDAMKAVDPTINIAVPVSLGTYANATDFTLPVLASAKYDAVAFHNYPMRDPITDGATLYRDRVASNVSRVRGNLLALQTALLSHDKAQDAIWATEWNGEVLGDKWSKQTAGAVSPMFSAMQLAEYMQAGVQIATWWAQGGTDVCSTYNYDSRGESAYAWWECGDTAVTYSGAEEGGGEMQVGLKPGDLTPAARAFQLLSESGFVVEGEHMLRTYSDPAGAPWLMSYAATHGSSSAVILINRDRDTSHTVPVRFSGSTSGGGVQQWTYGRAQYDATSRGDWSQTPTMQSLAPWSDTFHATLPPWSVNVFVFQ